MNKLDALIEEGNLLLKEVVRIENNETILGELMAKIKSLHTRGRFYLKKIDKIVFNEYTKLFSKTYDSESWVAWNTYIRTELEKCIGIFLAINNLDPDEIIDKTLNKIFISHGKFTPYFYKIESFVKALGLLPVYDINEPSQGKTLNQHVKDLMDNSDFYIILATKETSRDNKVLPNHNVVIEYDRLIQANQTNLIVLIEDECAMPSMLQDIIYINFNSNTLDVAFIKIATELNKSGLLN
jgi:predicted nucleotide-binding protein